MLSKAKQSKAKQPAGLDQDWIVRVSRLYITCHPSDILRVMRRNHRLMLLHRIISTPLILMSPNVVMTVERVTSGRMFI
jgi:hypothetical protein